MAMVDQKKGYCDTKQVPTTPGKNFESLISITNSKRPTMETDLSGSSISNLDQEELLKSTKAKMGDVKEENERLKKLLAKIIMDYKSLEKQITLMNQTNPPKETKHNYKDDDGQDPELVSLTLGSWTSNNKKYYDVDDDNIDDWNKRRKIDGLKLGLNCKFEYNNMNINKSNNDLMKHSSLDCKETKDSEKMDTWSSSGGLKPQEKTNKEGDDEKLHQLPMKKTRVCIRSRCETPTMHDGCQWRKYGQKIAKGNPCPRAYYRCTVSPTCPVRKQVQRCAQDMSILITTYEGTHNHPLPLSATAMASATTAAAAMIKTGPLTSQPTLMGPTTTTTTSSLTSTFHTSPSPTMINTNPNRLNIPTLNHSMITSSSHSHPTITLDLTTPNPIPSFHNYLSSPSIIPKNNTNNSIPSSSSFLNFSSSSTSWPNSYLNYGTLFPNNTINRNLGYQNPSNHNNSQQYLNQTIADVATKAIASNPNLQSALAAAISSYVGNTNNKNKNIDNENNNNNNKDSNSEKKISPPWQTRNSNDQLMLFPTSLSSTNNASSTADARDHVS